MIAIFQERILKQRQNNFLFLLLAISLIKCLVLFFVIEIILTPDRQIGYFLDSWMYEVMADNLVSGNGFSLSTAVPYEPTMLKEPLYPFFIASMKLFPQFNINFAVLIQILLNPLIALLIYFIGKNIFAERIARLSALLIALIPIYGEISLFIMPELLFTILLCATVLCLIKADKYNGWIWFILSGILLGLAALCRNAALLLFLVYPVVIVLKNRRDIKAILIIKLTVFILSFLVIVTPWMYRNHLKLGLFSISRRGAELLSHQAYSAANFSIDEWKAYSLYLVSGNLAQRMFPKIIGDNLGEYEYRVLMRKHYLNKLLETKSEEEVERILARQAIKDILDHPFKYLLLTTVAYVQSFKYFESISSMLIKGPVGLRSLFSLTRLALFITGLVYTLFALWGAVCSRKLFKSYLLLITVLYFHIVLSSVGIIPGGLQRHILPITVFYAFFVVIGIDKITKRNKINA